MTHEHPVEVAVFSRDHLHGQGQFHDSHPTEVEGKVLRIPRMNHFIVEPFMYPVTSNLLHTPSLFLSCFSWNSVIVIMRDIQS